ncbi:metallopeptidase family protein [Actinoallomurus liliacearum]|uniref:Metallopeptidase family protein n=1 Tax=Actinoallomurus liliacearum TaxID=1080073 RepID=A0ABP8TJY3_9ACTN
MTRSSTRRRDRRGRGLRGPLAPPDAPISRTRAERFDDLVREEARRLEQRWSRELTGVEFAVEEVPPVEPWADPADPVPLGRLLPAADGRPARIVVYRRPVEARGGDDERDRVRLVRDVVVEEVADLLGLAPESIDPTYESRDD